MRQGSPLPQRMQDAPELLPGLALYYNAWTELDSCRAQGYGPGEIPWHAVETYCAARGLDREETEDMHHLVRALDRAYLKDWQRRNGG